ncbi:hypothetical protein HanIR_Chr15g0729591 [Helianthus annuus]|nr:hypothetical protein HanIR_Chr15g0729591 [Helianthus annuus]
MDRLTQQLQTQPPLVLKSMLSKMKAVLNPSMTDHQPPEVHQLRKQNNKRMKTLRDVKINNPNHRRTTILKSQMCDVVVQIKA